MGKTGKRLLYSKLASYYDLMAPKTTEKECQFLDDVFKDYPKGKIGKILDLGCGTGRHTCQLQKTGYEMTGIDLASEMLKIARTKCPKVEFIKMDFTRPRFPRESFDASICMWTTIGCIWTKEKFKEFVKNIAFVTKFLFVFDSSNYENPAKAKPFVKEKDELNFSGVTIKTFSERKYDSKSHLRNEHYETTIEEKGKKPEVFEEENRLRMWSFGELKSLLRPEFTILGVYGDYSLKEKFVLTSSRRKIIVAEKVDVA